MKYMKKKRFLIPAALILAVCLAVYVLTPVPLFKNTDITFFSVSYRGQDLTEQLDTKALAGLLFQSSRDRFETGNLKYDPDTLLIELAGYADGDTFQILIGEAYQYFNDTEHTFYWIRDGKNLTAQLEAILEEASAK